MGVGILVLITKFWWVILLFLVLSGVLSYGRSVNERELRALRETPRAAKFSFSGEADLSNDSYILYLTKKFDIQKNDVLNKYVVGEGLYSTLDNALEKCHQLDLVAIEKTSRHNQQELRNLAQRKAGMQRVLLLLGVSLIAILACKYLLLPF